MRITFGKNEIYVNDEKLCCYEDFSTEDGYKKLFILLKKCVLNEELEFLSTEDCPPFGKKLKEILFSEFNQDDEL